jgi:hypothetical protein
MTDTCFPVPTTTTSDEPPTHPPRLLSATQTQFLTFHAMTSQAAMMVTPPTVIALMATLLTAVMLAQPASSLLQ